MNIINLTIVKLAISFTFGILIARFLEPTDFSLFRLLPFFLILLPLIYFIKRNKLMPSVSFGILTLISFMLLGASYYQSQLPQFQERHFSHSIVSKVQTSEIKILEILRSDRYYHKFIGQVQLLDNKKTIGKILLLVEKDSLQTEFKVDDSVSLTTTLTEIQESLNPHQFNYKEYMTNLGVYYQCRVNSSQFNDLRTGSPTLSGIAYELQSQLINKLQKTSLEPQVRSILQALILGEKRDIDKELYQDYAQAGAVHILAVSGLHVGILFLILSKLYSVLLFVPRGKWIRSIFIVISLWCFALLTGFSASVVRAVTMFSFLALAQLLNRPTSSFNTLFLSYFTLLLVNPMWLFHVGFQLSYLAVIFIIWLHPWVHSFYQPRYFIDKLLWGTITVSITAQMGVLPLSVYYFNTIPGLFLLTNVVVLPFLGLILSFGIIILILAACDCLPIWLTEFFNTCIQTMNDFISWVSSFDSFVVTDLHINYLELIVIYIMGISFLKFLRKGKLIHLKIVMLLLIVFQLQEPHLGLRKSTERLVLFNKSRETILAVERNHEMTLFVSDTSLVSLRKYPLKNYLITQEIRDIALQPLPKYFSYENQLALILDSTSVYNKHQEVDLVFLTGSPKVNLERIIDYLKPSKIIADASNYRSYIARWQRTCDQKKLPFHYTSKKGAFVWE